MNANRLNIIRIISLCQRYIRDGEININISKLVRLIKNNEEVECLLSVLNQLPIFFYEEHMRYNTIVSRLLYYFSDICFCSTNENMTSYYNNIKRGLLDFKVSNTFRYVSMLLLFDKRYYNNDISFIKASFDLVSKKDTINMIFSILNKNNTIENSVYVYYPYIGYYKNINKKYGLLVRKIVLYSLYSSKYLQKYFNEMNDQEKCVTICITNKRLIYAKNKKIFNNKAKFNVFVRSLHRCSFVNHNILGLSLCLSMLNFDAFCKAYKNISNRQFLLKVDKSIYTYPLCCLDKKAKDVIRGNILKFYNNRRILKLFFLFLDKDEFFSYFMLRVSTAGVVVRLLDNRIKQIYNKIFKSLNHIINTANVESLKMIFSKCTNIKSFVFSRILDTTNIIDISRMFYGCIKLEQIDLTGISSSKVYNMSYMFSRCLSLKSINLASLNTSNVTDMSCMFEDCPNLINLNLSSFETKKVTNMNRMFSGCSSLSVLDLSSFNTSNVVNMSGLFSKCFKLGTINLSSFNTSNVTDMSYMFNACSTIQSIHLERLDTSNVRNMSRMFNACSNLNTLVFRATSTDKLNNINSMFRGCSKLNKLDLTSLKVHNVINMGYLFSGCSSLVSLDLSSFITSSVTDMSGMFQFCNKLTSLDVSTFDTSRVVNMRGMFEKCSKVIYIDLSSFDTSNVTNMSRMFYGCSSIKNLNLSSFNVEKSTCIDEMLFGCSQLIEVNLSSFKTSNKSRMFIKCTNL